MRKQLPNSYACQKNGSVTVTTRTPEGQTISYEIDQKDLVLDIAYTDSLGERKNGRVFLRPVTAKVLRVDNILPSDLHLFYLAALNCYTGVSDEDLVAKAINDPQEKIAKFLKDDVISAGHWSVIEHRGPSFLISGVSRAFSHQLVRHRLPTYSQQSQRYLDLAASRRLDKGEMVFPFIIPPSIQAKPEVVSQFVDGIKQTLGAYYSLRFSGVYPEDARFLLPNATATRIVVSANRRVWMEIIPKRTCARAQWEIDMVITEVAKQLWEEMPEVFANVGPACSHGKCDQGKRSCGHLLKKPLSEFFGSPTYPHDILIFGMK